MKPLLLLLALTIPISAQTLEYDKFRDYEYYRSKRIEVYRNSGGILAFSPARVVITAIRPLRTREFVLWIDVDSADWQFIQSCRVRILADGKRFDYPCEVADSNAYTLARSVYVTESLRSVIPLEDYRTILKSKLVEMQIGAYEFKLKDKHIKELKTVDIAEVITSP